MSDSTVIQEFLVKLGFKVDDNSQKKMTEALESINKNIIQFGKVAAESLVGVELFVGAVAKSLDNLYFASKRTGASAQEIKAFGYAVGQMGGTAEGALSSLENLASYRRHTPGADNLLLGLGVKQQDLSDDAKVLNDLGPIFKSMKDRGQQAYAYSLMNMLGIDDKTGMAMMDTGQLGQKQSQYNAMVGSYGIDLKSLTESGHEFDNQLKQLKSTFGLLSNKLGGALIPYVKQLNEVFLKLTGGNTAGIPDFKDDADYHKNRPWYKQIKDTYDRINEERSSYTIAGKVPYEGDSEPPDQYSSEVTAAKSAPINANQVLKYFQGQGWSPAVSAGIAANVGAESGFDPSAAGDNGKAFGLFQLHPELQSSFAKWAGHDVHQSTADEQLRFMQYELTHGEFKNVGERLKAHGNDANFAAQVFSNYIERPSDLLGSKARARGDAAKQILVTQTNNINIPTTASPQLVANAVTSAIANKTRNLNTVIQ